MTPAQTDNDDANAVGRTRIVHDVLDAKPCERLLDLLGHETMEIAEGGALPPLAHWLYFQGLETFANHAEDGHPHRGDFLPALPHLPRRMWAGSSIKFHAPLYAGMKACRRSTIDSLEEKRGKTGLLVFAKVRHEIAETQDGPPLVTDIHTLVFREMGEPMVRGETKPVPSPLSWNRSVTPDTVMLFRYSALTWNSHRIHYDHEYVTQVEGYPGLVIHGPLTATLLIDLATRNRPDLEIATFDFRAKAPLFIGDTVMLNGTPDGNGATLVASGGASNPVMEGALTFR